MKKLIFIVLLLMFIASVDGDVALIGNTQTEITKDGIDYTATYKTERITVSDVWDSENKTWIDGYSYEKTSLISLEKTELQAVPKWKS